MASLWEQMITEERRQLANQLGLRVSEVEEQQTLLASLKESQADRQIIIGSTISCPTANAVDATDNEMKEKNLQQKEEDDEEQPSSGELIESLPISSATSAYNIDLLKEGGSWWKLPQVLVDIILMYIGDVDSLGYLLIASKSSFQVSEKVYRFYCETIYAQQTTRRIYKLEKWKTWRNMLIYRPRLRTNGFYTLRTLFSKAYCNDNFWEERQHQSVEVKYYRHLRFFDNGSCLYSLDIIEPQEMKRILSAAKPIPRRIYLGRYYLYKNQLTVEVKLHYCDMIFQLLLADGDDGYQGKHNMLTLIKHTSLINPQQGRIVTPSMTAAIMDDGTAAAGVNQQHTGVNYPLPINPNFRFYRCWEFAANQLLHS